MTPEEVKALSDEDLRIKVAELRGECSPLVNGYTDGWRETNRGRAVHYRCDYNFKLPGQDYSNNLNAMHEAEMQLTKPQFERYVQHIFRVFHIEDPPGNYFPPDRTVMCATARQRAEAFVLTMEDK